MKGHVDFFSVPVSRVTLDYQHGQLEEIGFDQ